MVDMLLVEPDHYVAEEQLKLEAAVGKEEPKIHFLHVIDLF